MDKENKISLYQIDPLLVYFLEMSNEIVEIIKGWDQEYIPLEVGKYLWETHLIESDSFQIFEQFYGGATLAQGTIPSGDKILK